jgi:hypothetical protein
MPFFDNEFGNMVPLSKAWYYVENNFLKENRYKEAFEELLFLPVFRSTLRIIAT